MSIGLNYVKSVLNSLEASRTPYHVGGETIDTLSPEFQDVLGSKEADFFKRKTLFGFVPAFEKDGTVSIYIRFGGPEIIRKAFDDDDDDMPELKNIIAGEDLNTFYGANNFRDRVDTIDSSDHMIYRPDRDGMERHIVQLSVLEKPQSLSQSQLRYLYPFRLVPRGSKFELQYAPFSTTPSYKTVEGNDRLVASFVSGILQDSINALANTPRPSGNMTESKKTSIARSILGIVGVGTKPEDANKETQALYSFIFNTMGEDFATAMEVNARSYFDGTGGGKDGNTYDGVLIFALAQLSASSVSDLTTAQVVRAYKDIANTTAGLKNVSDSLVPEEVARNAASILGYYVSPAAFSAQSQEKISKLEASGNRLTRQNARLKAKNEELVSPKKYRNVGMAAGLISSYMAVTQESAKDMDLWKKALIIAGGTGLGAIPYINFLSIATMPYLVDKGIELSGDEEFKARTRQRLTSAKEATATAGRGLARAGRSARDRLRERRLGQDGIMEAEVVDVVEPLALPTPEGS